jgi:BatD DUF11 like domain
MINKFVIIYSLAIVILFSGISYSQSFNASTNNTTVGVGEQFEVDFTYNGKDINGLRNFNPPNFANFLVLSGPNQSTSMQIINGAVSGSLTYSYILQPKNLGKYSIGIASIDYSGTTYKTSPLEITVVKGSQKPQQQNSSVIPTKDIADNLFIKATVDRSRVYLGQQVTVTYKLYTRLNIAAQMSISKLPNYEGFWSEEIETPNNINFTTEVYNGKQYKVGILKKAALFPSQTGELEVTSFELNVPVQIRKKRTGNNFFDDFFNDPFGSSQVYNYDAKSNSVKIHVMPLPSNNVPKSFNGAVGDFSLKAGIDKTKLKTNQSFTLKVTIAGSGNLNLINPPSINFPNGIEQYQPKTNSQINRKGTISGSKTIEYLLVARTPGRKEIPSIDFSYFNPERKSYVTLSSRSFAVDVEPGENIASDDNSYYSKQDIKMLGEDIRYIKTSFNDIEKVSGLMIYKTGFWAAVGVPLLAFIGLVGWKKREDKLAGNVQLLKFQKAQKVAKNRLKEAKKLMESNNHLEFYSEISQALFGYLEDKLHIPKSEISFERAADEIRKKSGSEDLIDQLKNSIDRCEYVRFAPNADQSSAMHEIYNNISKVIIEIEKNIFSRKAV